MMLAESNAGLHALAQQIEMKTGLSYPGARLRDLRIGLAGMARAQGYASVEECVSALLSSPWTQEKINLCAAHLTIGETYFFREPRAFDLLCEVARGKLHAKSHAKRTLRLWSAACCTGEEAYSAVITLLTRLPEFDASRISILATDLNPHFLSLAREGLYRPWSLRRGAPPLAARYLSRQPTGEIRVDPAVREMVQFRQLNLVSDAYPFAGSGSEKADIIFCRNVLMYFSRRQAMQLIARMRECLVEGGWLIVSPGEASSDMFPGFAPVHFPDAIFFQKTANAMRRFRPPVDTYQPVMTAPVPRTEKAFPSAHPSATRKPVTKTETGAVAESAKQVPSPRSPSAAPRPPRDDDLAIAMRALESGDPAAAVAPLRRTLYANPDAVLAHYWLGVAHHAMQKHAAAGRQFRAVHALLAGLDDSDSVPGADQLTVGHLREALAAMNKGQEARFAETA